MTGAQIVLECLKQEGVSVVFGYPGATIAPFYDALAKDGSIRHVLVRQEQNAGHAASGYSRASGKVGVCCTTSGPGATNLITGLATAYMDSIPMVALTGQVRSDLLGRDVFQEADITGACEPFTKHSYLATDTQELPTILKEAFHIAATGRPGPVLIDLPQDTLEREFEGEFVYPDSVDIIGYKPRTKGHPLQMKRALEAISEAERPVICAGGGVVSAQSRRELLRFAEKLDIPVVSTLMGVGMMPTEHPLYMGMLGTHGIYSANYAIHHADLVILCGARVGDRAMSKPDQIAKKAQIIHIDIDPAEIGKNMKADIPIVGDIRLVLKNITEKSGEMKHTDWVDDLKQRKAEHTPVFESIPGQVDPRNFMRTLSEEVSKHSKAILVADVGENQIWSANNFAFRGGRFLTSGGLGTMGYSLGAALGAKIAKPQRQVFAVCGDGSFQMMMCELATLKQHDVPVKVVIMQNNRLGMVRELQDKLYEGRYSGVMLDGSPDFVKLAQAYDIPAECIDDDSKVTEAIGRMLGSSEPYVLVCKVAEDIPSRQED